MGKKKGRVVYRYNGRLLKETKPKKNDLKPCILPSAMSEPFEMTMWDALTMMGMSEFPAIFDRENSNSVSVHRRYAEVMAKHRLIPFHYTNLKFTPNYHPPKGKLSELVPVCPTTYIVENITQANSKKDAKEQFMHMSINAAKLFLDNKYALYGTRDEVGEVCNPIAQGFPDINYVLALFDWVYLTPYEAQRKNRQIPDYVKWCKFGELVAYTHMNPDIRVNGIVIESDGLLHSYIFSNATVEIQIPTTNTDAAGFKSIAYTRGKDYLSKREILSHFNDMVVVNTPIAIQKKDYDLIMGGNEDE